MPEGFGEALVVAVEAVGNHRAEGDPGLASGLDERGGLLRLGPKPRIALALRSLDAGV